MSTNLVKVGGRKAVNECLTHENKRVKKITIRNGIKLGRELEKLLKNDPRAEFIDADQFEKIAPIRSQGVFISINAKGSISEDEFLKKASQKDKSIVLFLDGIKDIGNFGSMLRLSESAGVDAVYFLKNRAAPLSDDVRSYSVGASEFINTVKITNATSSLKKLKKSGYWVVSTTLEDESIDHWDLDWPQKTVLVIGSEDKGISQNVKKCSDFLVKIPMYGKIQSLNAAHSAAIVLYEIKRNFKNNT